MRVIILLSIATVLLLGGCTGGANPAKSMQLESGNGPSLIGATPKPQSEISREGARDVILIFDRRIDTGAQFAVTVNKHDVVAGGPRLSSDRLKISAEIDLDNSGSYTVTYRVCSAKEKTACTKGSYRFLVSD